MGKVAIIGAGVAGVSSALLLDEDITIFEKKDSLISGPPFCHLHAGGNLYPNIPLKECKQLLKESIDFAKIYPFSIDYRPTVMAFPKTCQKDINEYIKRLDKIQKEYKNLIQKDISYKVLGEAKNYYKIYSKNDILKLKNRNIMQNPQNFDEWMIPFAKYTNLDSIKFPVIIVNEYGLNMFNMAAAAKLLLQNKKNVKLNLNSEVVDIKKINNKFLISYISGDGVLQEKFDYLINAAGFSSGKIDDFLGYKRDRLVEFKAAYISKWKSNIKFPEIVFHGKRGTPQGMAQFTPYAGGYFQLHGMTKDITLFNNGLFKNKNNISSVKLDKDFIEKIEFGWNKDLATLRTKKAIKHFEKFIPQFAKEAKSTSTPLFGAQQIPGYNPELRAAEVSFEKNYARCEIVKVSSAISMVKEIAKEFNLKYSEKILTIDIKKVEELSKILLINRNYPKELAIIMNKK